MLDSTIALLRALQQGQRQLDELLERAARQWQLSVPELRLLLFLSGSPGRDTATDAAAGCGMSKASVSGNVLKLATRGLLTADMDLKDRRLQHLTLTEAASPVLEDLWQQLDRTVADALAALPPEREQQLLGDLAAVARRLSRPVWAGTDDTP